MIHKARRRTAYPVARIARAALRSRMVPPALKHRVWRFAERYVSFFGVVDVAPTIFGGRLRVDTANMVEKQIFYCGQWEPNFTRYLMRRPQPDRAFIDLGANIGYFTILAARLYARVVAVEASPAIFARLQANVALNDLGNVDLVNVAVGESARIAKFYQYHNNSGKSSLIERKGGVFEAEVPVRPLFDIIPSEVWPTVGMIKIDIEGLEHVVIRQLLDRLDALPADLRLMVEYDPSRVGDMAGMFDQLRRAGFRARLMQGPYAIAEYLDAPNDAEPAALDAPPAMFCDLLFERT